MPRITIILPVLAALALSASAGGLSAVAFCAKYFHEGCAKPAGPCDRQAQCVALVCSGDPAVDGACRPDVPADDLPDYCTALCTL